MTSNKSIPKCIHQIWLQGQENIPPDYEAWRQSIIQKNPSFDYTLWCEKSFLVLLEKKEPDLIDFFLNLPYQINQVDFMKYVILYQLKV